MGERERGTLRGPPLFVQPRWSCARGDQVTSGAAARQRRPHRLMAPGIGPKGLPFGSELAVRGAVLDRHDVGGEFMKARNSGGNPADLRRFGKPQLKGFMVPPRGVHGENTASTGPADPGASPTAAKATTCQLKGFMVPQTAVHGEDTGSTGLAGPGASPTAAKATTCLLKGFMVPPRGVHDGRTASVSVALAPMGGSTTPSATRPPSPLPPRTRAEPTAAERRPASSRTWCKRHIGSSQRQGASGIASAGSNGQRRDRVIAVAPAQTRGMVSEPTGFTIASPSAPITQAHKAEEAGSKMDDPLCGSWGRCRWLRPGLVPEVPSASLRWAK
jgi:hypothetical protein